MSLHEVKEKAAGGALLVIPLGSIEQHGPHLTVDTDTLSVEAIVEKAVASLPEDVPACLSPVLWLGASNHHRPFFALSIDESTYSCVIEQIISSAADAGFCRFIFINGHGGNSAPLRTALNGTLRREPRILVAAAEYWSLCASAIRDMRSSPAGGMGHAGELETSIMLHIAPEKVRMERASRSVPDLPDHFRRDLVERGPISLGIAWERLSASGVIGDPTHATEEKGKRFFELVVVAVRKALEDFSRLDPEKLKALDNGNP
jgi:creatinine amidohydrolase